MIEYNKTINIKIHFLGYKYFVDSKHPLSQKCGIVYLHRHIASIKENRWIKRTEVVHHIDGNRLNNSPENLMVLSSSAEHAHRHNGYLPTTKCSWCYKKFKSKKQNSKFCSCECAGLASRKTQRPSKKILSILVWSIPTSILSKRYCVSDNSISKWCKSYGISKPGLGYWSKIRSHNVHS